MTGLPDKREVERALRGAGLSARQAKRLLSGGWRTLAPEEPMDPEALGELLEELARGLRSVPRAEVELTDEPE